MRIGREVRQPYNVVAAERMARFQDGDDDHDGEVLRPTRSFVISGASFGTEAEWASSSGGPAGRKS